MLLRVPVLVPVQILGASSALLLAMDLLMVLVLELLLVELAVLALVLALDLVRQEYWC